MTSYLPPLPPDWPRTEARILDEVGHESLAVELWLAVRKLRMWAETPAEHRPRLFRRSERESGKERRRAVHSYAPELHGAMRILAELKVGTGVTAAALVGACTEVADWASERSLLQTAAHFARAAAAVSPEDPAAANLSALMYRRASDWGRADQSYARAIVLAHKAKNAVEYICGHIGSAALLYSRGMQLRRAIRHLGTAARVAEKSGRLWLAGHALHDSMLLMIYREDFGTAESQAERAAELYPLHDRRFPFFVADFALVQLMQYRHSAVIPLIRACLDVIEQPSARGVLASMLARSYAGLGDFEEFRRFQTFAVEFASKYGERTAATHFHLAEGARACRSWSEAERHAETAQRFASEEGDRAIAQLSERSLGLVKARDATPLVATPTTAYPEKLGRELAIRLARWNPQDHPARRRVALRNHWVA